jgi:hypothetical protein
MSCSSIYTMFSIDQCVHPPSFAPVSPPEILFTLSDQDLKVSLVLSLRRSLKFDVTG